MVAEHRADPFPDDVEGYRYILRNVPWAAGNSQHRNGSSEDRAVENLSAGAKAPMLSGCPANAAHALRVPKQH